MDYSYFDQVINDFVDRFNSMSRNERKDFLIRDVNVSYETGSSVKRYNVTYHVKRDRNVWKIRALGSGFWIFRKVFPLFVVTHAEKQFHFTGLYTDTFPPCAESLLSEKLQVYLEFCKKLPQDAFVKS